MQMTLGDIISKATTFAGGRLDWAPSEVSFYANLSALEIHSQLWHLPTESVAISSTTSGEATISLPSDFEGPISLSNLSTQGVNGGRGLQLVQADWIDSQTTVSYAEPEVYALFSSYMQLWPTPDSSYSMQLRYWGRQPTLVDSSSTPNFDERYGQGWLWRTVALLEASRNNLEGEAVAQNRYVSYMGSIKDDRTYRQQAKEGMSLRYKKSES